MWLIVPAFSLALLFAPSVGQVSSPPTIDFTQLGIASIVCALLFAWGLTSSRRADRLERENARLLAAAVTREREYGDTTIPLLTQAIEILRDAKAEARAASGNQDLVAVLQRVEASLRDRGSSPPQG